MPNITNIGQSLTQLSLIPSAAYTATGNGTGVDLLDYEGDVAFLLDSGAGTGTSPTLDVKLQDSADNSTFADISGAAFTQVTGAASRQKLTVNSNEIKRYVRAVRTIGGTTPSFPVSLQAVGIKKYPA